MKVKIGLHDVSSTNRLMDTVKVAIAYKDVMDTFIVSRPTGAAAQYGVPEASKKLYKEGIRFILLPDINDYQEIFKEKTIQITTIHGENVFNNNIEVPDYSLILISGNDNGFSKNELLNNALLMRIPKVKRELPSESTLGIIMYILSKKE